MAIHYKCGCGADIRLPHTAVGRKAKCKSCGTVFTIPRHADVPAPAHEQPPDQMLSLSYLDDLANNESQAAGEPVVLDLSVPPPVASTGPARRAAHDEPIQGFGGLDEDREGISGPRRNFWADLAVSFFFFVDPGNLVTFIALSLAVAVTCIPMVGCFMWILPFMIGLYIRAVLLATVRESASGEDQLPSVWITSFWDDLILPALQFAGTWVFAMLPAVALAIWYWADSGTIDFSVFNAATAWRGEGIARAAAVMTLLGQFFWPAVVLSVAIGGTFRGLWPHIVVRTALCAPIAYSAICAAVLIASAVAAVPHTAWFITSFGRASWSSVFAFTVLAQVVWLYSSLVEMRAIGLYYRHYKHRLPWAAE